MERSTQLTRPLRVGKFNLRYYRVARRRRCHEAHHRARGRILPQPYLIATTIESAPMSGSTRVCENPASRIHAWQSAPVKSKPPVDSRNKFKSIKKTKTFFGPS